MKANTENPANTLIRVSPKQTKMASLKKESVQIINLQLNASNSSQNILSAKKSYDFPLPSQII